MYEEIFVGNGKTVLSRGVTEEGYHFLGLHPNTEGLPTGDIQKDICEVLPQGATVIVFETRAALLALQEYITEMLSECE